MFTGIIEGMGTLRQVTRPGAGMRLSILPDFELADTRIGDSVAVCGACLTVVEMKGALFTVDVGPETVSRTILKHAAAGDRVNLERALRLGSRLDGHLVTGHVDGTATLVSRTPRENVIVLAFEAGPELTRYMVEKGSVAVDGVSLTLNACSERGFSVAIIPHTAKLTTVGMKNPGDRVNIETDIIGKYVERFVTLGREDRGPAKEPGGMNMEYLAKHGFL